MAIPEAKIVALINVVVIFASNPNALAITRGTTTIPPKAANICCKPNNIFLTKVGLSSTP